MISCEIRRVCQNGTCELGCLRVVGSGAAGGAFCAPLPAIAVVAWCAECAPYTPPIAASLTPGPECRPGGALRTDQAGVLKGNS